MIAGRNVEHWVMQRDRNEKYNSLLFLSSVTCAGRVMQKS
jgi:hypothetical protein